MFQKLSLPPHGRFFVLTPYPLRISIPEGFVKTPLFITMPPSGKKARLEPCLPLKILATEPLPSPMEFLMPFHWRGHNRYFLELHISLKTLTVSNFWRLLPALYKTGFKISNKRHFLFILESSQAFVLFDYGNAFIIFFSVQN